jgi:hypothetical protein
MADEENKEPKLTDAIKKLLAAGMSGALLSEEVIRSYVADLKLPKEVLSMLVQGAQKSKDDISQRISKEVIAMIHKIDFVNEFSKFAETHKFRIQAEIEVIKREPVDKENKSS